MKSLCISSFPRLIISKDRIKWGLGIFTNDNSQLILDQSKLKARVKTYGSWNQRKTQTAGREYPCIQALNRSASNSHRAKRAASSSSSHTCATFSSTKRESSTSALTSSWSEWAQLPNTIGTTKAISGPVLSTITLMTSITSTFILLMMLSSVIVKNMENSNPGTNSAIRSSSDISIPTMSRKNIRSIN